MKTFTSIFTLHYFFLLFHSLFSLLSHLNFFLDTMYFSRFFLFISSCYSYFSFSTFILTFIIHIFMKNSFLKISCFLNSSFYKYFNFFRFLFISSFFILTLFLSIFVDQWTLPPSSNVRRFKIYRVVHPEFAPSHFFIGATSDAQPCTFCIFLHLNFVATYKTFEISKFTSHWAPVFDPQAWNHQSVKAIDKNQRCHPMKIT